MKLRLILFLCLSLTLSVSQAPATAGDLRDQSVSAAPAAEDLVAWARPKVVLIQVQTAGRPRWGTGFIADRGRVITNEHVVRDGLGATVWANGSPYRAHVAAVDPARDLAALVLPEAELKLKPLTLARDGRGRPGEPVLILASRTQVLSRARGYGAARVVRVSPVAGTAWDYTWLRWPQDLTGYNLRLLAHAIPGDSGSPVLRLRDGAVIGILRGRTFSDGTGRSETAWAVPVEAAHDLLARARQAQPPEQGAPERFYLESLSGDR